jgi:monoamine oxidase
VSRIDHGGRAIRLETARGAVTAARVIVTVPTSIIAGEMLRFDPPLPDKIAAAAGLPLGSTTSSSFPWRARFPGSRTMPISSARPPRGKP